MTPRLSVVLALLWFGAGFTAPISAQSEPLRGPAFQRALRGGLTWSAEEESLAAFAERLRQTQRLAIHLDRRLDPTRRRDFRVAQVTALGALCAAAEDLDAGACAVGDVVYVGPAAVAAALPMLIRQRQQQLREGNPAARKVWGASSRLTAPRLSCPAELLRRSAEEHGLTVEGFERIPHDLLRALDWPPLSLADQWTLLLVGFDLWPQWSDDGMRVAIVDLPIPASYTWLHPVQDPAAAATWASAALPDAAVARRGSGVELRGTAAEQGRLARWLALRPVGPPPRGATVVTLQATASIGAILRQIAEQRELELTIERAAQPWLERRIDVDVKDATYEELLTVVLGETPLTFELDARRLRVFPR